MTTLHSDTILKELLLLDRLSLKATEVRFARLYNKKYSDSLKANEVHYDRLYKDVKRNYDLKWNMAAIAADITPLYHVLNTYVITAIKQMQTIYAKYQYFDYYQLFYQIYKNNLTYLNDHNNYESIMIDFFNIFIDSKINENSTITNLDFHSKIIAKKILTLPYYKSFLSKLKNLPSKKFDNIQQFRSTIQIQKQSEVEPMPKADFKNRLVNILSKADQIPVLTIYRYIVVFVYAILYQLDLLDPSAQILYTLKKINKDHYLINDIDYIWALTYILNKYFIGPMMQIYETVNIDGNYYHGLSYELNILFQSKPSIWASRNENLVSYNSLDYISKHKSKELNVLKFLYHIKNNINNPLIELHPLLQNAGGLTKILKKGFNTVNPFHSSIDSRTKKLIKRDNNTDTLLKIMQRIYRIISIGNKRQISDLTSKLGELNL